MKLPLAAGHWHNSTGKLKDTTGPRGNLMFFRKALLGLMALGFVANVAEGAAAAKKPVPSRSVQFKRIRFRSPPRRLSRSRRT